MAQTVEIEEHVTVGALADKLSIPVSRLISELMKNGVMVTVNERIDFDTAQIIIEELGIDVKITKKISQPQSKERVKRTKGSSRPPVVAVMGHVDHGKTSLLDAIRGASVTKQESGGITQHISAYQVTHNDRLITFLDTPGHEAFAALREHGAQLTDLVIIVVAADDGVKPQTIEAIRFARKAGVKIIVAVNKIDKEGADLNRVKQELAEQDLLVEEWGGDTIVNEVSAKTKQGIDSLLDMVLLVSDVEQLVAEADIPAKGLIIEAHMERGRGPIAIALVEEGTLKNGDYIVTGTTYAKIRNLESVENKLLTSASPSTPVVITGFKALPEFGNEFVAVKDKKTARQQAEANTRQAYSVHARSDLSSSDLLKIINHKRDITELPVLIKADVQGSLTSVVDSIKTLDTDEVATRVVGSGVGTITENDVHMAHTSNAIIYGFHIEVPVNIKRLASRDKVVIRNYSVIYELIDDVKTEMSKLLAPEQKEEILGKLVVKGVFKTTKTENICGGEVTEGKLSLPAMARILRGDKEIAEVEVTNLKRGPQDTKEAFVGELCGLSLSTTSKLEVQEGDQIELFRRELVERQL